MEDCVPNKKLKSALSIIKKLYEVETDELCEDEMKLLYTLTKKLRKKIKKLEKNQMVAGADA